jgi:Helix-turn-helix domain
MSATQSRRPKLFGAGRPRPIDREGKVRLMHLGRALMRRTEKGKAYGAISAKALAVLQALLWTFHNGKSGLCYPSYEKIAEAAGCARSTVAVAIQALELAGVLTWVHRLVRVRPPLGGRVPRVIRTSNGYQFNDPAKKSDFQSGTSIQDSTITITPRPTLEIDPSTDLGAALLRYQTARERRTQPA